MKLFLALFLTLSSFVLYAQTGTIRGTVIEDETGEPIIGANILIVEAGTGNVTDLDGQFSIDMAPGTYTVKISYVGFQELTIEEVEVTTDEVTLLELLRLEEFSTQLNEVVVTAKAIRTTETALMTLKKKAPSMLDGISSARFRITGDATAVEAAKRVTGVSIEGGKYVYVRGLGDRYSKTTLNNVDIPGLDPDRNTLQLDIFPTNLINNIVVTKNFTADLPADFTGGLLNIETKDFPEERILSISVGTEYNPNVHFRSDYLNYQGGGTDFLGFDDGTRQLQEGSRLPNAQFPSAPNAVIPGNGISDQDVNDYVNGYNKTLATDEVTSILDFSAGISYGDQFAVGKDKNDPAREKNRTLGFIFSLSYKSDYTNYTNAVNGEWQRFTDPARLDLRDAIIQDGNLSERNFLLGGLAGLAYKSKLFKIRLTAMHLQNGTSRSAFFNISDNGEAIGRSGYFALSDNLEYNQRSLTNVILNGTHVFENSGWEIDWRVSPTLSTSTDPDIRKTAFTRSDDGARFSFVAGAGGNPVRIWRFLDELNANGKVDITKEFPFLADESRLKFGASFLYKERDYEILLFDQQFFGRQPNWPDPDPDIVLDEANIYPDGTIYFQTGNPDFNPNAYNSNVQNTGGYVSYEFSPLIWLKAILGVRAENFVQRHTGRDQSGSTSLANLVNNQGLSEQDAIEVIQNDPSLGRVLDNDIVLNSLDFFPTANFIFSFNDRNNIRAGYSRTIARPSFKELSFAQILDPVSNRIFNGSLFPYPDWDGNLVETRINNFDLRWELFLERGQLFSVSAFVKTFDNPIELVRIPTAPTGAEFQPRNVGDALLVGLEFEIRKDLDFISTALSRFNISANLTLVQSQIDMSSA